MAICRLRIACWIPKATDTFTICNIHCFSTAKVDARTRLNFTLYLHCLSCSLWERLNKYSPYQKMLRVTLLTVECSI
jgi:hypothetical protein